MLDFLPKGLDEFTVPEKMDRASVFCSEKVHMFVKEIFRLFYKDNHSRCNFPVKKLKLESLKFSFFRE